MLRVQLAVLVLIISCTASPPSTDVRSPAPSATRLAATDATCLSGRRLDFLADQFFSRYNARDLEGFLGLFNFSASAAGGGFGSYYDNAGGEVSTMADQASLSDYVRGRWARDDRFVKWSAPGMPDGLGYPNANPTMSSTRTFGGVTRDGNVKLVCNAGLLVDVVMSAVNP